MPGEPIQKRLVIVVAELLAIQPQGRMPNILPYKYRISLLENASVNVSNWIGHRPSDFDEYIAQAENFCLFVALDLFV